MLCLCGGGVGWARDTRLGRDVAVKIVPRTRISSSFESVAKAAVQRQQLRDPGFIRVYDSFRVNGPYGEHLVLVMEYFEGKRLLDVMAAQPGGRFDTDSTVSLLRRAAEALRELHRSEFDDADPRDFGFGPMLPEHLFYDQRAKRVRLGLFGNPYADAGTNYKTTVMLQRE